jgi:O-antigen/teichoic acid export membrane protein
MPLAVPVVVFARPLSVMLFQEAQGESYLALTIAALVGMLALRSAQMHFQVHGRFTPYGVTDLLNTVLRFGGIATLLLLAVPSTWQVLAFFAFAPIAVTVGILLVSARPLISSAFSTAALSELAATVKWYMATAATGTLISRMDIFLVSAIASVSEAGILSAAQAIALVPQLVGTYIAVVFSPRIMPMWQAGTLKPLYQRFQFAISGVALLAFAIAWFAVSGISDLIFPAAFARSGEAILVLLPAGLAALVNFPLTILLVLFLRPKFLLVMDCVLLPLLVATYLWVIPRYGAIGAAAVTSVSALLKTGIMQTLAWRLLSSQPVEMAESFEPQADPVPEEVLNA